MEASDMAATATKAYRDHTLGNTAEAVLKAFYSQIGSGGLKPFGRDVHQGFEFFLHHDGKLYKKEPGVMIPLTGSEEKELVENVSMGAVELYLRRPTAGLPPYPVSDKVLLHAATGQPIPLN
jgi:hypothetical protein